MKSIRKQNLTTCVFALFVSLSLAANAGTENINGFSGKQSEVVIKAFEILSAQNWDQLTDENLVTLSQAAAIAMDTRNEHYNPKAAFAFMTKILEIQYEYKPLNELTQKVFKSAVLSVMSGDYRLASESERVLRNPYEFHSDLRQMREMLKKAKVIEQRKANECLFVNTLSHLIGSTKKEHLERFRLGKPCLERPENSQEFCDRAYASKHSCQQDLAKIFSGNDCVQAEAELLKAILTPPVCANPVDIAAKLNEDAPYISIEQIEKTLSNEDTELAFNMGLAFTNPATQKKFHIIRDGSQFTSNPPNQQEVVNEDEEFDLDGSFSVPRVAQVKAIGAACKTMVEKIADFTTAMDGPRFKTVEDARAGKPMLMLGAGSNAKSEESKSEAPPAGSSSPGFWSRILKMFGA